MKCPVVLGGIFSVWGIGLIGLCLPWNIPTWVCLNRYDPLNRSISRSLQLAALVDQDRIAYSRYPIIAAFPWVFIWPLNMVFNGNHL
jgi:hypothetical protein